MFPFPHRIRKWDPGIRKQLLDHDEFLLTELNERQSLPSHLNCQYVPSMRFTGLNCMICVTDNTVNYFGPPFSFNPFAGQTGRLSQKM
jgi:hypothetical protein